MKIDTVKDLQQVIELCRKTGVESIKIDNIEITLGQAPIKQKRVRSTNQKQDTPVFSPGGINEDSKIETDFLTPEQLLYYSTLPETP